MRYKVPMAAAIIEIMEMQLKVAFHHWSQGEIITPPRTKSVSPKVVLAMITMHRIKCTKQIKYT